jgi:hypothetical protein
MGCLWERNVDKITDSWRLMLCKVIAFSLLMLAALLCGADASAQGRAAATITSAGTILTMDGAIVPPFPKPGSWTELQGKSSDRYESRHFMYMVQSAPPAIELYVTTDKRGEAPDGVFEMGLVRGFLSGFCGKAGFTSASPVFQHRKIGSNQALCSIVQLSKGNKIIWLYAYIYPREPSLTFLTVRAEGDTSSSIETYLSGLNLK